MAGGEKYVIEFVGDPTQFAPGANAVLAQLKKIETAAKRITTSGKEGVSVDQQKSVLAQKRRMDAFQELNTIQKIALLEERRLRIAERISSAQSRGLTRRSDTLSQGLMTLDGGITLLGGGASGGFRRRMRQANVTGVSGVGGTQAGAETVDPAAAAAAASGGSGIKGMLKSMAIFGGAMSVLRGVLSMPSQARELDTASKKTEEMIQKYFKLSQGSTTSLGQIANMWTALVAGMKKGIGEIWSAHFNGVKLLAGMWMEAKGRDGNMRQNAIGKNMMTDAVTNLPKWMGGQGGSGESAVMDLQTQLDEKIKAKRDHYVDQILDGIRDRIAADKQAYHERMEKRRQDRIGDRQFAYGGEVGKMIGSPANGMFAAGAGAGVASTMLEIEKQTLVALRENVVATKKIAPEVAKLGINYFNNY